MNAVRRQREYDRGIAMHDDHLCCREKRDLQGFYGLAMLKQRAEDLDGLAERQSDEVREQIRMAELRLAPDRAEIAETRRLHETYGPVAAKRGLTQVQLLEQIVDMELTMQRDINAGFFKVCDHFGLEADRDADHDARFSPGGASMNFPETMMRVRTFSSCRLFGKPTTAICRYGPSKASAMRATLQLVNFARSWRCKLPGITTRRS